MILRIKPGHCPQWTVVGPYIGSGLALLFGGPLLTVLAPWAGHPVPVLGLFEPWRGLFLMIGLPGLFVGLAVGLFIREPVRLLVSDEQAGEQLSGPAFLKNHAGLMALLNINAAAMSMITYTIYAWIPTFLSRVYSLPASEVGLTAGAVIGLAGVAGCLSGSWMMSLTTANGALVHVVRMLQLSFLCLSLPLLLLPLAPSPSTALLLLGASMFLVAICVSSSVTPLSLLAPPQIRGRVIAIAVLFHATMAGGGPFMVGVLNDYVFKGTGGISHSMFVAFLTSCILGLACSISLIRKAKAVQL